MSIWVERTLECGRCGAAVPARVADGLNITRNPDMRRAILEGTLHITPCPKCGAKVVYERGFVFTDLEREQFMVVEPRARWREWRQIEEAATRLFEAHIAGEPSGTLFPQGTDRFRVRAVFGYAALREKLLLWDAGVDDACFECFKLAVLGVRRDLVEQGYLGLVVDRLDDDTVGLLATGSRAAPALEIDVERAALDSTLAEVEAWRATHPALFSSTFVDLRRYL